MDGQHLTTLRLHTLATTNDEFDADEMLHVVLCETCMKIYIEFFRQPDALLAVAARHDDLVLPSA